MAGTDEINSLNLKFCDSHGKSLCRLIENQGDYSQIITVQPFEGCPVRIQFSLYGTYPKIAPDVFVKNATDKAKPSSVPEEDREELREKLQTLAESAQGKPMLSMLVDECVAILKNKSPANSDSASLEKENTERSDKPKEKPVQDAPEPVSELSDSPPKSKMRTASDVISRILWDDKLDRSCFTVGYNDRFTGLIEEKFNAFTWDQPLSAVDNDTLAIPQHRIQYFKYKQVKVWDKNERLDLVFGSTGDGADIYALVDQFESAVDKAKEATGDESEENEKAAASDDEIDFGDLLAREPAERKYPNLNRPNFFVAVRMTDPEILGKAQEIADHITGMEPIFKICCLPVQCLHITLATLRLNDINEITQAVSVLHAMRSKLRKEFPEPIELELNKLDNFYHNVLYANVVNNLRFEQFADSLRNNLQSGGLKIVDNHSFVPHMTLMKITRPIQRQFAHSRKIDPSLYQKFRDTNFGKQIVGKIYLCPIGVDRREDGFYQTVMEMDF